MGTTEDQYWLEKGTWTLSHAPYSQNSEHIATGEDQKLSPADANDVFAFFDTDTLGSMAFMVHAKGRVESVELELYTQGGRRMSGLSMIPQPQGKGRYKLSSPKLDQTTSALAGGVYLFRLRVSNGTTTAHKTGKFVILR